MNGNEIIKAQNLAAAYQAETIWSRANFTVRAGEFVAVVGPNGAGKTTLFRLLLGLLPPLSGTLNVFGEKPRRGQSRIAYIPQRHQIDHDLKIEAREFVRLGLDGHRWGFNFLNDNDDQVTTALRTVGAEKLARRSLGVLSGGELQRIFLAQALVGRPELLLLDEPLSNLDIKRESAFVQLINDVVRSQGVTVLLIAHNINPLLPVLDQVIYIAGAQVATGQPQTVLTSESLSRLYDTPIEVLRDSHGRIAIIGTDEATHHHDDEGRS